MSAQAPAPAASSPIHPKVQAAAAAGAASIVLVWAVDLLGVTVPPEVASAVTTLIAFAAGYLKAA